MSNQEPKPKRAPRYKRTLKVNIKINERDIEMIKQVSRHRFLASEHIAALVEGSKKKIIERLQKLYQSEYLDRPREQVKPTFHGNQPMVYALGNRGADLLAELFNQSRAKIDWTNKNKQATHAFLEHSLMVSNFMVCLDLACRSADRARLIWPEEILSRMPLRPGLRASPFSWKVNVQRQIAGKQKSFTVGIVPDLVFGLEFQAIRKRKYFFLEADRSTMPIMRGGFNKSSYFKKLVAYWHSQQAELIKEIFGFAGARVLTLAISAGRIGNMIEANKEVDERKQGLKMFYFAQAEEFTVLEPGKVFAKVWQNGRDEELSSLMD